MSDAPLLRTARDYLDILAAEMRSTDDSDDGLLDAGLDLWAPADLIAASTAVGGAAFAVLLDTTASPGIARLASVFDAQAADMERSGADGGEVPAALRLTAGALRARDDFPPVADLLQRAGYDPASAAWGQHQAAAAVAAAVMVYDADPDDPSELQRSADVHAALIADRIPPTR